MPYIKSTLYLCIFTFLITSLGQPSYAWTGPELMTDICAVLETIEVSNKDKYRCLLLETANTESDGAEHCNVNGNYGIWQIRYRTAHELLQKIKTTDNPLYRQIMRFAQPGKNLRWNLQHNSRFGAAMCAVFYMDKNPTDKQLATVHNRAVLWKTKYNTSAGKGTVRGYLKKNRKASFELHIRPLFATAQKSKHHHQP